MLHCNSRKIFAKGLPLFDSLTIGPGYVFPVTNLDDIMIERIFSPIAGLMQHRFGVSQWRLALVCLDGCIAFYLGGIALTIAGKGMADGIFTDLLAAMGWLGIMTFARSIAYRQASSSIGVQSARLGEWMFRTVLAASLPLSLLYMSGLSSFCFTVSLLFLIAHLYFKACDTPPPQPTRKVALNRA